MRLLRRWFNYPPTSDSPFITDKYGEKFWIDWDEDESFVDMRVLYRGKFVGLVYLDFEKPEEALLIDINIFRFRRGNYRLRNRGLGKAMLEEAIAKSKEHKVKLIWGWIAPHDNTTVEYLEEWYRRQGFEIIKKDGRNLIKMRLV